MESFWQQERQIFPNGRIPFAGSNKVRIFRHYCDASIYLLKKLILENDMNCFQYSLEFHRVTHVIPM